MNAPAYQGIKDFILARIDSGEWGEGVVPRQQVGRDPAGGRAAVLHSTDAIGEQPGQDRVDGRIDPRPARRGQHLP